MGRLSDRLAGFGHPNNMIGLIMCAGRGTRLGLKDIPKCMVDVGGKPILERVANYLEKQGVEKIIVNLSYFPEVVMKYFGQRFLYLYEPVPMGEFATVSLVKGWFPNEDICVVNGDTLIIDEIESLHCGETYYYKDGSSKKVLNKEYIDMGTPKGLEKAREYVRN